MKNIYISLTILLITLLLWVLQYFGIIWHTTFFTYWYPIHGLDISHYQWDIDWKEVAEKEDFHFVFMKATEWHDFIDKTFKKNWKEAKENGFPVWAYHFFSMRSSGTKQAELFKSIVPIEEDSLPHVIDLEIPTTHEVEAVQENLLLFSKSLEDHYWKRPILYVTYETYNAYIIWDFLDHELWFRDIVKRPSIGNREWLFWQYSNRWRIHWIEGYVDKNVFYGTKENLYKL